MWTFFRAISHIVALAGAIVAFFLLYHCGAHCATCKIDTSDTIVNTMSILVTILIGWNIFTALDIKHTLEKKEREANELKVELQVKQRSLCEQIKQQEDKTQSAEYAYITLFNASQGQVSIAINAKDYLQQYSHFQTALNALLKCKNFPSDIRHNIQVLLDMMEERIDCIPKEEKNVEQVYYTLSEEDKKEFFINMDEIIKSSREEFSIKNRMRFMEIAHKAKHLYGKRYKSFEE